MRLEIRPLHLALEDAELVAEHQNLGHVVWWSDLKLKSKRSSRCRVKTRIMFRVYLAGLLSRRERCATGSPTPGPGRWNPLLVLDG
jgi:hypothetical protein